MRNSLLSFVWVFSVSFLNETRLVLYLKRKTAIKVLKTKTTQQMIITNDRCSLGYSSKWNLSYFGFHQQIPSSVYLAITTNATFSAMPIKKNTITIILLTVYNDQAFTFKLNATERNLSTVADAINKALIRDNGWGKGFNKRHKVAFKFTMLGIFRISWTGVELKKTTTIVTMSTTAIATRCTPTAVACIFIFIKINKHKTLRIKPVGWTKSDAYP